MKNRREKRKFLYAVLAIGAVIVFLAISLLPPFISSASAATQAELKSKISESQSKKAKAQQDLNNLSKQKEAVVSEKKQLDEEIAKIEDEVSSVNSAIAQNEAQIAVKESEIAAQQQKIELYDDEFKTRARVMYKHGSTSYLDVLFGADSFSDLLYKVQMVKKVIEYDKSVLSEMKTAKQAIVDAKTAIEDEKTQKEMNREILQNNQDALESKLAQREAVINSISNDEKKARQLVDEADAEMEKFRNQLAAMSQSGQASSSTSSQTVVSNGSMQWPSATSKTITSPYGSRYHPIQKRTKFHSGIDIGASYGTAVLAAESGTVIKAGWNGGYGKCVVIDHGGGVYTLYGHNSALSVSIGAKVSKGQTIAQVGSTGNSTGPHIHFEVLINGKTTNPLSYVG